jgi:hypothetical protein
MALLIPEALKRMSAGGSPLTLAMLKTIVTVDALFARIPMAENNGPVVTVPREGAEPTGGNFIGDDDNGPIEESTGTDDVIGLPLRRVVGDMDVDSLVDDFTGGAARDAQFLKKVKATARKVQDKFINGGHTTSHTIPSAPASLGAIGASATYAPGMDSLRRGPGSIKYTHTGTLWQFRAPGDQDFGPAVAAASNGTYTLRSFNQSYFIRVTITVATATANAEGSIYFNSTTKEFDGLPRLVTPAQTIDPVGANGDFFSLAILDKMISNLKVGDNPAFIMSGDYIEAFYAIMRALGGTDPNTMMIEGYGQPVPTYRGIPILRNDWILSNETVGSSSVTGSLYLANLDAEEGLYFAVANMGERFDPQSSPDRGPVLGWRVDRIGALEGKDRRRTRLAFYGAPVLKSPLAAVRRRGVLAAIS